MRPIKLTAILLLAGGTQLLGGAQLYAQPPDIDAAAAAKADAGREAQSSHPLTQAPGPRAAGTFITFDVPGARTGFGQGTFPTSINEAGEIAGSYVDANYTQHSFVRARSGALTTFDVPGGTSTEGSSINSPGSVTGSYVYLDDPNSLSHGYLRTGNGRFTTFD
ncbi:MAG TPA: hypothetical protein VMS01_10525, partial [Stellaceae bacterium]|nr:hypothetical protein [Stellaceae bacterium]